jgi:hypothetical protein
MSRKLYCLQEGALGSGKKLGAYCRSAVANRGASNTESCVSGDLEWPVTCSLYHILRYPRPRNSAYTASGILNFLREHQAFASVLLILGFLPPGITFLVILLAYVYIFQNSALTFLFQNDEPQDLTLFSSLSA